MESETEGPHILIVDDEPGIRELLTRLLRHHGYASSSAADGEAALAMTTAWAPDLVITDMIMPGIHGSELMEQMRQSYPMLPFIVITGNPRVESAVNMIKNGAADYITKPFDLNEILIKVRQVLRDVADRRHETYVGTIFGMKLERVGDYEIDGALGEGASGVVFRATRKGDSIRGQWVIKAFKLPGESNGEAREAALKRFYNEAQVGKRVQHPNVVTMVDHGILGEGKIPYLVMTHVEGRSLAELTAAGQLPPARCCEILADVADALAAVHEVGIVHRDVKPGNVMIDPDGRAILMDFGVAHFPDSSVTRAEMIIGSPAYMAPESFLGSVIDARADQFSLGVMGYELLTGGRPFIGDTLARFAQTIPTDRPAPPSRLNVAVNPAMEAVLARLLKKDPEARFASASEAAAAFRAAATSAASSDWTTAPVANDDWEPDSYC